MAKILEELRAGFLRNKAIKIIAAPNWLSIPERIATVSPESKPSVKTNIIKPAMPGSEGGNNLMAKNLEELRKENPELATTVEAEIRAATKPINGAIAAERKRLQEIDEIASAINDDSLVHEAKYGANPYTAQELAYRAATNKAVDQGVSAAKQAYRPQP